MRLPAWLWALTALCVAACATPDFDLQGHRGARGLAPENTLPAFERALAIGVTTLELDVAITRDGVVVVSHDPRLNPDLTRGPDGRFLEGPGPLIRDLSFAELQAYDVGRLKPGTVYASRQPQQQAVDGTRIPCLADLFALVRHSGNTAVRFSIETKVTPLRPDETIAPEPFARALIAAVREGGMARRTTIQSFDWRTLATVQREAPEMPTVYLTIQQPNLDTIGASRPEGSSWTRGLQLRDHGSVPKMVHAAGGRIWSAYFGDLNETTVKEAHALGLQVLAWTVNAPKDIERVLDLGVDGLISDRPDVVREAMQRRGMKLPPLQPILR